MRPLALILLLALPAAAADELADNLAGEWTFGASNTNAVAGHGRLTAAFSADGELTLLAWPGPSGPDQLLYFASNDEDARTQPRMGAQEGMGSRLGLLVTTGAGTSLTWLRDWPHDQGYTQPDAPVPVTRYHRDDLGIAATLTDVVLPDRDVLSRQLSLQLAAGSPVTGASLVLYENLSPTLSEIPQVPIADWALPARNDFVAVWDAQSEGILHFHPGDRGVTSSLDQLINPPGDPDYGPADAVMKSTPDPAGAASFAAQIDAAYPAGVAAIVSTEPAPSGWQVGNDATPYCDQVAHMVDNIHGLPAKHPGISLPGAGSADLLLCSDPMPGLRQRRGWTWAPADALADLQAGGPSGSVFAAGQTNGVLVAPLTFSNGVANGSGLFALGSTRAAAQAALQAARAVAPAQRQAAAEQAAHAALANAALPDASLGSRARAVALRALVNIYVAREAATGAIVASVSRQPPYHLDWPRDGAFIDAALEVAGLPGWATQRLAWMAGLQRAQPTQGDPLLTPEVPVDPITGTRQFPAGAWEMNYYGDGQVGGPIRFEIDNSALHLWSLAAQAATLPPAERAQFLSAAWPSAKTALQLLRDWHGTGGLPAPANEDDHADLTSTLHGAVAVYAALVAGERLARAQSDGQLQSSLQQRAAELRAAILDNYYDAASGLFRATRDGQPGPIGGPAGWMVWPARLLDKGDPRIERQLAAEMDLALKDLRGETSGAGYLGKSIVAAALYGAPGGSRDQAAEAVQRLANMATDGTDHFGEIFETQPDGTFLQAVATPHVWEGALFYLSAMALSQPQRFNPEESALALGGGGCSSGGPLGAVALLALALFRRSRRTHQPRP